MKLFYFIILFFLMCGCSQITIYEYFGFGKYPYDLEFNDTGDIKQNCVNVCIWINSNIKWESNKINPDINRIMQEKKGDCKDQVFLMIDLLYTYYGYKASIIIYDNHALCYFYGYVYDVVALQTYHINEYKYKFRLYNFDYCNLYWYTFT